MAKVVIDTEDKEQAEALAAYLERRGHNVKVEAEKKTAKKEDK